MPVRNLIFVFVLPSAGAVAALVTLLMGRVTGVHVALFVLGFVLTGLGITVGYHRMLTHRSFEAHPVLKTILLILGSMAVEGPAVDWVANHVKHHAYSDGDGDPHSPREGLLHAHWGWLSQFGAIEVERYAAAASRDPIAVWVSRTFIFWVIVGYLVPLAVGGWEGLIWGGLFRQLMVQNVTFSVNSVCHRWGRRAFQTDDLSRNNWLVGIFGLGEGWHNNHHAFPSSAYHGLRWWEVDVSGYLIRACAALRLVSGVKRPTEPQLERKRLRPVAA